jgi:hypothetical protein
MKIYLVVLEVFQAYRLTDALNKLNRRSAKNDSKRDSAI